KEHRIIRNATRNSSEAKTDDERRDHRQVAQEARERAARLEADLVHLAAAAGKVPVDADAVARVLAAISDEPDLVDDKVANALRAVLADFRLVPVPGTNKGRWQVNLVLPMGGGTLTVGPATGTIELGT